jgi:DNA-binding CsgD family transcriptional regulator
MLPVVLTYASGVQLFAGELSAASLAIEESESIAAATGNAPLVYGKLLLAAFRGVEAEALQVIEAGLENATARGEGRVVALAAYATAVLCNGLGHYEAAIDAAERGCEDVNQGYAGRALAELVEAAVRAGRPELAASALVRLEERTSAAGTYWALGVQSRSQALLADGNTADAHYRTAIDRLAHTRIRIELARAHLLYGEWLRREGRRVDAREQLRTAFELFSGMGAEAFADRADRELRATGETARRRADEGHALLTPQEAQIARLAQEGLSNPEIGAQLFISPRTVQYHLRKVFAKLEISSRSQLARLPAGRLD